MVALMIWLLVVAAIGTLVVVAVLRPARQSGHRASTVFTRRQAAKERKRLEEPVRSADERLAASGRSKNRARRAAPGPAPAPRRASAPAAPDPAPEPATRSATPVAEPVAADDSVIDARTRWANTADQAASPGSEQVRQPDTLPPASEQLRRAE